MDRIDIHIEVPSVPFEELASVTENTTNSESMRRSVDAAREGQAERFKQGPTRYNAQMTSREVRKYCSLSPPCTKLLRHSVEAMGLSARAHDKILRVSRTIADIEGAAAITEAHLGEAINYRSLDSDLWT